MTLLLRKSVTQEYYQSNKLWIETKRNLVVTSRLKAASPLSCMYKSGWKETFGQTHQTCLLMISLQLVCEVGKYL